MTATDDRYRLDPTLIDLLRGTLPDVAQHTIAAVRE